MRINSINKGKNAEREFCKLMNNYMGLTAEEGVKRTPNSGGLSIKGDIIQLKGALSKYHWELKSHKKVKVWDFVDQSKEDCPNTKTPLVVMKREGTHDWYVVVKAEDFLRLVKIEEKQDGSS